MLLEGVPPAMIENIARMAGMPVGPLSLNDEIALDLAWRFCSPRRRILAMGRPIRRRSACLDFMVEQHGRFGRKNGKGFYDYPASGKKTLWPGLAELAAEEARSRHARC